MGIMKHVYANRVGCHGVRITLESAGAVALTGSALTVLSGLSYAANRGAL
jgi:hypothetical protein